MLLAAMVSADEDALICDLAETYHVFDYRSMPSKLVATLAAGLSENSRSKRKIAGLPHPAETLLLAMAVDRLSYLVWAKTEDGQKNRNRPESVYMRLMGLDDAKKTNDVLTFESGAAFDAAWKRMTGGEANADVR